MKRLIILGMIVALCLMAATGIVAAVYDPGGAPSGDGVDPVWIENNPNCADLNSDNTKFPGITSNFGFKVDECPSGTFTFTDPPGELTGSAPPDPTNSVTLTCDNPSEDYFSWVSTRGIDAVIVKGGPNADAFVYVPEDTADTLLHTPINPHNGELYGISHIEFCYDPDGVNPPPPNVPEFPTLALPVAMTISIIGLVYIIKQREK